MLEISAIPAFNDNYIWLLTAGGTDAVVVDPGDAAPVMARLDADGLSLAGILVTHHHGDHVGGVNALLERWPGIPVWGSTTSDADCVTVPLNDGDAVSVLGHSADVSTIPGHTLDHIAFFFADAGERPALFCGDTLFAGGCGRVFEGDAAMMLASLNKLSTLPAGTRVYCAHEYTLSNLRFARAVEPANATLEQREQRCISLREQDIPTVPSILQEELETNPFLRCETGDVRSAARDQGCSNVDDPVEVFASIRGWKDGFR